MKSMDQKEKFIELRAQGKSFNAIAEEMQIAKNTLISWSKEFEMEISNMKAMEMDALQEQYFISKKRRLEVLGERITALKTELEQRELKDIPTKDLYAIFLRYVEMAAAEEVPVKLQKECEPDEDLLKTLMKPTKSWAA